MHGATVKKSSLRFVFKRLPVLISPIYNFSEIILVSFILGKKECVLFCWSPQKS